MKIAFLIFLALLFTANAGRSAPAKISSEMVGTVVGITDGDTITVLSGKTQFKVRLSGIDAPEKRQPFGAAAKQKLSDSIYKQPVVLVVHGKDRNQRSIADVFVGKRWINLEMVRSGYAWRYTAYSHDPQLIAAEDAARSTKRGLWVDPAPVAPWDWRKQPPVVSK